ncbi:MAG TPA: metallophosphoesterase [Candidatus Lokiarchaeia archaeon]|nr:metallophosphoesterase [Candidatus Lokiarchaeia archaeon]
MDVRSKRIVGITLIFAIGLCVGTAAAFYGLPDVLVESPKFGMPAFKRSGDSLQVSVILPTPLPTDPSLTNLTVAGIWGEYPLAVQSVTSQLTGFHAQVTISARIPSGIPAGLYNITIATGALVLTEPHALDVVADFKSAIRIVHISDLHIEAANNQDLNYLRGMVSEINLVRPDVVICTGDVADLAMRVEWDEAYNALLALQVPLLMVLGNHDLGSVNVFYELFAPQYYSVDYGTYFHFTAFNTGDKYTSLARTWPCWDFLTADLAAAQNASQRIVMCHIPPYDKDGDFNMPGQAISPDFDALMVADNVGLLLVGHVHQDEVSDCQGNPITSLPASGPVVIQTHAYNHYRIIEISSTSGVTAATYDPEGTGAPASITVDNLSYSAASNDGTSKSVTLQVINNLNQTLTRCRFTFALAASNSTPYVAVGGNIMQVQAVGSAILADVTFSALALATTNVTVREGP